MDSTLPNNAIDGSDARESTDTMEKEYEEDLETSNPDPDFYTDDRGDSNEDQHSNGAEEAQDVGSTEHNSPPRTPRASESSANEEDPSTPSLAPISWQEAAESKTTPAKDPNMPSFTDKAMLAQLEVNANQSAANLVVLVHHLRTQLANISALSVQYMSLHKAAIEGASEHVHDGIASAQKLILKAQSLNTELKKVYSLQQDIKDTKKMLGQLEKLVEKMTKT